MDTSKIIRGVVSSGRYTVTAPIVKEDYGLYLKIEGVELPSAYEVDFSNSESSGTSVTMIGNADGVLIPRQFIDSGKDVFAFLYHVGANYGRTVYKFRIPNKVRPDRTDEEPTPEEQSVIDQAISVLNTAVAKTAQDVISADQSARSASDDADRAESARDTAQTYANNAQASATSASQSATASANSASQAQGFAQSASASAQSASGYASQAQTSAQTASSKATEASTSAQTASTKATESAQSATSASQSAQTAEQAKTASQTAQGLAESARDSAVSAKTDAESARDDAESARDEAQQAVASISGALIEKAPIITDTASGSIASFSDGADDLPLKSLIVDINPVQDLHGQDSPYPAGGGKNKAIPLTTTLTVNGVTVTCSAESETITLTGTGTSNGGRSAHLTENITLPAGTYIMSITGTHSGSYIVNKSDGGAYIANESSFTLSEETTVYVGVNVVNGTTYNETVKVQLESGSTATSYAPYENICPISGWTEVDVEQSGVNVWDEEWELGTLDATGNPSPHNSVIRSKNYTPVVAGETYYFKVGTTWGLVYVYDKNKSYIRQIGTDSSSDNPYTMPSNAGFVKFRTSTAYGTTYNHDISINYPSTDHDYHPYTGRSITIDLGQTVYGGKLDVLTGVLTVDKASIVYDGSSDEEWIGSDSLPWRYGIVIRDIKLGDAASLYVTSNLLPTTTAHWSTSNYGILNNYTQLVVGYPPAQNDVAEFKAFLASNPLQVVYLLETPIAIQLTPNQVNSLYGVNNLWADSGDTTAVYRADTKAYIAKKIAEALASLT